MGDYGALPLGATRYNIIFIAAHGLDATTTRPDHARLRSATLIGVLVSYQLINDQLLYNDQLLWCCYETRQTSRPIYACVYVLAGDVA